MASSSHKYLELTPEQIALSEARKAKKLMKAKELEASKHNAQECILARPWISPQGTHHQLDCQRVKVLTWNILAQCLVRRELFPTSTCLKAGQRDPMIYAEILSSDADILCLQEVDRTDKLLPIITKSGYSNRYTTSPGKKHGCMIAFKSHLYSEVAERVVHYDNEEIRPSTDSKDTKGRSFNTRNIGLITALKSNQSETHGVIIATTHLFWHPKYTYERARQAGILVREVQKFRSEFGLDHWPCIIAGDFNCPPEDPVYSLLVGDPLLPEQEEKLAVSRVVHVSVDPSVPVTSPASADDEGENEETQDPDRIITNARSATGIDGLLSSPELVALFAQGSKVRSAYDEGLANYLDCRGSIRTYGDRITLGPRRHGSCEPEYTSYTHYWKTVLDYIFILDPVGRGSATVAGLLSPHQVADIVPGLPKKGVCASDHISLAAELVWPSA